MPRRLVDRGHPEDGAWGRWARFVLRRPIAVAAVGLVIVGVLAGLGTQLNANEAQLKNFPGTGTAIAGRDSARRRRHQPRRHEAARRARRARRQRPADRGQAAHRAGSGRGDRTARPGIAGRTRWSRRSPPIDGSAPGIQAIIDRANTALQGTNGTLTGVAAVDRDFLHALFGSFPYVLALVLILTLILLTRAFRSIVLAVKAVTAQPGLARRGLRGRRLRLPAGPRLLALEHRREPVDHRLDPGDDLRLPVRALDGLRGVHALSHA